MSDIKPIKVLMVCAMGMSSSLLEAKTREAAQAAGVPFELQAINTPEMARWDFQEHYVDVVLVAPQVRYKRKSIAQAAEPFNIAGGRGAARLRRHPGLLRPGIKRP